MGKIMGVVNKYPVPVSAAVALGLLWAYHNGHLNQLFSTPAKTVSSAE